jgi:hypothetical protein
MHGRAGRVRESKTGKQGQAGRQVKAGRARQARKQVKLGREASTVRQAGRAGSLPA